MQIHLEYKRPSLTHSTATFAARCIGTIGDSAVGVIDTLINEKEQAEVDRERGEEGIGGGGVV